MTALPDFLLIGAMKAATTSLHDYLRGHPGVFMPPLKEVEFFSFPENWSRGLDWYRAHFRPAPTGSLVGEASTGYSKYPEYPYVAERVSAVLPRAKLIYCVRDPIDRAFSHHAHEVMRGRESRPLGAALAADPRYLSVSSYGRQLQQHLRWLPGDRVLILNADDLRAHRRQVMQAAFRFLGVDPDWDGYLEEPELYVSAEQARLRGPAAVVLESRLGAAARRRIPPRTKGQVRQILGWLDRRDPAKPQSSADMTVLRSRLEEILAPDQAKFAELRAACRTVTTV